MPCPCYRLLLPIFYLSFFFSGGSVAFKFNSIHPFIIIAITIIQFFIINFTLNLVQTNLLLLDLLKEWYMPGWRSIIQKQQTRLKSSRYSRALTTVVHIPVYLPLHPSLYHSMRPTRCMCTIVFHVGEQSIIHPATQKLNRAFHSCVYECSPTSVAAVVVVCAVFGGVCIIFGVLKIRFLANQQTESFQYTRWPLYATLAGSPSLWVFSSYSALAGHASNRRCHCCFCRTRRRPVNLTRSTSP